MPRGEMCLISVAMALVLTAFITLPAGAQSRNFYRIIGDEQQYDCRNRGPCNYFINDLRDARNRLNREIAELPQRIREADRKQRAEKASYDQAFTTTPPLSRAEIESLYEDWQDALAERERLKGDLEEKKRQRERKKTEIAQAGKDFTQSCACVSGEGVGQCR